MTFGGPLIISGASGSSLPRRTAIDANHIHVWALDEASGTTWANTGVYATTLTPAATPNPVILKSGLFGNCVYIRSRGASVEWLRNLVTPTTATFSMTALTIECWARINYSNSGYLLRVAGAGTDYMFIRIDGSPLANSSFYAVAQYNDGLGHTSSAIGANSGPYYAAYNTWHHFMATWDSDTDLLKLYFDGNLMGSAATMNSLSGSGSLYVGGLTTNDGAEGSYCDIRISNIARDQTYADTVYRRGLGLTLRFGVTRGGGYVKWKAVISAQVCVRA